MSSNCNWKISATTHQKSLRKKNPNFKFNRTSQTLTECEIDTNCLMGYLLYSTLTANALSQFSPDKLDIVVRTDGSVDDAEKRLPRRRFYLSKKAYRFTLSQKLIFASDERPNRYDAFVRF